VKNKVLISGNGKGNSEITRQWMLFAVIAVVVSIPCLYVGVSSLSEASDLQDRSPTRTKSVGAEWYGPRTVEVPIYQKDIGLLNVKAWYWLGGGAVFIIGLLIYIVLANGSIAETKIDVYEDMVTGKGFDRPGSFKAVVFQLAYDQISSVDVTKNTIIVRAARQHKAYKCHVLNPAQIRKAILARIPR